MTISEPCMPPLGLKPKPTQPVVLTASWNVMFPWRSSKPHFRHTRRSWSRYSMKGRPGCDDPLAALVPRLSSTARRGSGECMAQWSVKSGTAGDLSPLARIRFYLQPLPLFAAPPSSAPVVLNERMPGENAQSLQAVIAKEITLTACQVLLCTGLFPIHGSAYLFSVLS